MIYLFRSLDIGCSGLIYKKSVRLLKSAAEEGQNGTIINLLSNDLSKFDIGLAFLHDVWKGPFEALAFFIVIYMEIGVAAVAGMAFLASFIPLQGKFNDCMYDERTLNFDSLIWFSSMDWPQISTVAHEEHKTNGFPS